MEDSQHDPESDVGWEPARAVDAAFERGDPEVGTAVVELVLSGVDFDVAAARVERALRADEGTVRRLGHVATGDLARLHGRLTPALYGLLRAAGLGGAADSAIKDVLTFVPFRDLPAWFRYQSLRLSVRDRVEGRLLRLADGWATVRDRLSHRD
ncbi:hypothetical protein ABH931_000211 [Streptacidiphilus sp. MAP12-33]|uniref:hypothetical protein n=1 Tax=Streptacidiphilus sp. MAP12-33 TaxID=3156266 RepID=UPI0035134803